MGKGRRRREALDVEPDEVQQLDVDEVTPPDADGVRTVGVFTILWAIAFVILAFQIDSLEADGRGWWLWTCLAGVGLGLLGLEYTRKRRDAIELARAEAATVAGDSIDEAPDNSATATSSDPAPQPAPETSLREAPRREERSSPDAVTRPIDTGNLPAINPPPARPIRQEPAPPANISGQGRPERTTDRQPPNRPRPDHQAAANPPERLAPRPPTVKPAGRGAAPSPSEWPPRGATPPGTTARRGAMPPVPGAMPAAPSATTRAQPPAQRSAPSSSTRSAGAASNDATGAAGRRPRSERRATELPSSELFGDLSGPPSTQPGQPSAFDPAPVDDEPLLDTLGGGRRARHYDITDEIDEITDGGGRQYRGRRARRSDSA